MVLWFWVSFLLTLALLSGCVWSGRTGRRRAHFVLVGITLVALVITVRLTEVLVSARIFPEAELAFHLRFAIGATVLLLPVAVSGVLYARRGGWWRRAHQVAVVAFLLTAVMATGTGVWIFSLSEPR